MRQNKLTLIVPIRLGADASLRQHLQAIGDDIKHNTHLHLADSPSTHFARFVILNQVPPFRLLFSSCYACPFETYIAELVSSLGTGLDEIFAFCEGYDSKTWNSVDTAAR